MQVPTYLFQQSARLIAKILPWILMLQGTALTAQAKSGVEGAQLDYVALDNSVECNRILFQSSQHFKGTLFMIPRVVQGRGLDAGTIYSIQRGTTPGTYVLSVNIYFPANDEVLKSSAGSAAKRDLLACNWDRVKKSLNQNIQDPDKRIHTIARIPLTSIEMRIPGIASVGVIDPSENQSEEADILDYYGKTISLQFTITEREKETFESQLVHKNGISSQVKLKFQARSREGSVHVKVDTSKLVENLSAAAALKGLKYLAAADLSMLLQSSVTANSIQVVAEGSQQTDVSRIAQIIIDKVLKEVSFSLDKPSEKEKAKSCSPDKSGVVCVSTVLEILKSRVKSEFSYNSIAAPESATAQTNVRLYTDRLFDPNTVEVELKAGYNSPHVGITLNAGHTISITPMTWMVEEIVYSAASSLLTMEELKNLNLAAHFPDIMNRQMVIKNVDVNENLYAEGVWESYPSLPNALLNRHHWVRYLTEVNRYKKKSDLYSPDLETLQQVPVRVSFSEISANRFFQLSDLLKPNRFFSARFDEMTGRIYLTALQNLGSLRFRLFMDEAEGVRKEPKVLDQVVQFKMRATGATNPVKRAVLKEDKESITMQKTIFLNVTRPEVTPAAEFKKMRAASGSLN